MAPRTLRAGTGSAVEADQRRRSNGNVLHPMRRIAMLIRDNLAQVRQVESGAQPDHRRTDTQLIVLWQRKRRRKLRDPVSSLVTTKRLAISIQLLSHPTLLRARAHRLANQKPSTAWAPSSELGGHASAGRKRAHEGGATNDGAIDGTSGDAARQARPMPARVDRLTDPPPATANISMLDGYVTAIVATGIFEPDPSNARYRGRCPRPWRYPGICGDLCPRVPSHQTPPQLTPERFSALSLCIGANSTAMSRRAGGAETAKLNDIRPEGCPRTSADYPASERTAAWPLRSQVWIELALESESPSSRLSAGRESLRCDGWWIARS